jgi:hypothetical protein
MLSLVDRHRFERLVREHKAERGAKGFSCWSQFVAMMFCQLAQAKSLREIIDGSASLVYAHVSEGNVPEIEIAPCLESPKG